MNNLSLNELSCLIKETIGSSLNEEYWVTAEIAQINCHYNSGHCYLDLIEKQDNTTIARMRATIWSSSFRQISTHFRTLTGQDLLPGMKILMLARVIYHEVHGLSLNIRDIDPRYTLGEMALKRRQIMERLIKEGLIDKNRQLSLPPVIQKIAVISSVTAAGYGDFLSVLNNNPYGFRFSHRLFQAYMQGDKAEESILKALKKCIKLQRYFDAVVIIRGGGSVIDLHSFDSYPMAKAIALSPLPVFTGIGHEKDETVADRVANKRLITPSAAAEFLIAKARQFEDSINELKNILIRKTTLLVDRENHYLKNIAFNLSRYTKYYLKASVTTLRNNVHLLQNHTFANLKDPVMYLRGCEGRLKNANEGLIKSKYQQLKDFRTALKIRPYHIVLLQLRMLENVETKINLLDPRNVLKKGYSITYSNGEVLKEAGLVREGVRINTRLFSGLITSIVESIQEDKKSD